MNGQGGYKIALFGVTDVRTDRCSDRQHTYIGLLSLSQSTDL